MTQTLFGIFCFAGLFLFLLSARYIIQQKYRQAGKKLLQGVLLFILGGLGLAITLNYAEYTPFSKQQQIATLSVNTESENTYQIALSRPNQPTQTYFIQGKTWELDASILQWRAFMHTFNLHAAYRLEKVLSHENDSRNVTNVQTIYELTNNRGLNLKKYARFIPGISAAFGTAVYMPLKNHAKYAIYIDTDGLVAEPINNIAIQAMKN